MHSIVLLLFLK